ncbi:hypothetical protein BGZ65_010894 [Modicella reniformis]|uniref:UDP-N-acetylglucosamine transferase subunit ALG13 n=1 Tax=Modicella reniformis TaxID=1440133 RepID=A0A9P6IQH2_9FUNG|nr:hypothetical protein BGZ65_010894 [Modicella reniformis]
MNATLTLSFLVWDKGFGHATRVNQVITELLKSTTQAGSVSRHIIYIVSDAPQFIFQDVIALGAIYRNAKVDAGVVQPLAYSVDRQKTIEGCKSFLSRREELIQTEVSWLEQVGVDCVLADAPFLPCAAASAYGIPAILITNFTFDEVYRYLCEGDDLDEDVIACADAALEDYKKASLLLRLPGFIDIPAFEEEVLTIESSTAATTVLCSPPISDMDDMDEENHHEVHGRSVQTIVDIMSHMAQKEKKQEQQQYESESLETCMGEVTPAGIMTPISMRTAVSSPSPSSPSSLSLSKLSSLTRKAIDVPLVVRMAVNSREVVLRSLGMDEETIATKKVVLVSFGGQQLTQGWGNPLPDGWIGVICGLPADHELPEGFYRSPHGVYVPDLTEAADIVIGKLGYGTCSECIAHDRPLIYVPRPQFVEEHGLIKMMKNHGLAVGMSAKEFELGHWQRAILEADRMKQQQKQLEASGSHQHQQQQQEEEDIELDVEIEMMRTRRRRSSLSVFRTKGSKIARLTSPPMDDDNDELIQMKAAQIERGGKSSYTTTATATAGGDGMRFRKRIPNNGGEVCARLVEEFMAQLEDEEGVDGW